VSELDDAGRRAGTEPEALELAYRHLNRRERTVAEVRQHLVGREIAPGDAEGAIQELIEQGALDDARFARLFVQDKRTLEHWGTDRIRRGLAARGIDRELAEEALADGSDEESERTGEPAGEIDRALSLLRRRFAAPPRERRERERAMGVLLRKGYEYEIALDAIKADCAARA
jgi:regulatory protein